MSPATVSDAQILSADVIPGHSLPSSLHNLVQPKCHFLLHMEEIKEDLISETTSYVHVLDAKYC